MAERQNSEINACLDALEGHPVECVIATQHGRLEKRDAYLISEDDRNRIWDFLQASIQILGGQDG
ncbi:MAG: hypothetical protein KAJ55_00190 [Anaerolineales bacterium]|nr:hypothetical protein [Anaerolineales bacterium]